MEDILKLLSQGFEAGQKSIDENENRFKVKTGASVVIILKMSKDLRFFSEILTNRKSKPVFRHIS